MASESPMGEPDADVPPEVAGLDSKRSQPQEEPAAAAGAITAAHDPVPGLAATEDAAEGVAAGDDTVVDEVSDTRFLWKIVGGTSADATPWRCTGVIFGCSLARFCSGDRCRR